MRVTAATLAGGHRNQDAYAVVGNAAMVLDGASSFTATPSGRDGGWYATHLLAELTPRVTTSTAPLTDCLRDAIKTMRDVHGATIGGPSSTVVICRWTNTSLELLVLGDSYVVIERPDRTWTSITDQRLATVAPAARRRYQARLTEGHGMDDDHRRLLVTLQAAQLKRRNRSRGYWIAEADPDAANHAITDTIPLEETTGVLLASDGAAAAVEDYRRQGDWTEHLKLIRTSPALTLSLIHEMETRDPDGQQWPRAKRHDDKTFVLVEPPQARPT